VIARVSISTNGTPALPIRVSRQVSSSQIPSFLAVQAWRSMFR
jgi:hypothetical protein